MVSFRNVSNAPNLIAPVVLLIFICAALYNDTDAFRWPKVDRIRLNEKNRGAFCFFCSFEENFLSLKTKSVGADVIFKELRFAQSKEDIFRQSTATNNEEFDQFDEEMAGGDLLRGNYDEKSSAASFQQALMQWRQTVPKNPTTKTKKTHEAQIDTVYDGNGTINQIPMPKIEFNSSKLTYGEKLLVKKYRRDKNSANADRNSEVSTSRTVSSRNSNIGKTTPEKLEFNVEVTSFHSDLFLSVRSNISFLLSDAFPRFNEFSGTRNVKRNVSFLLFESKIVFRFLSAIGLSFRKSLNDQRRVEIGRSAAPVNARLRQRHDRLQLRCFKRHCSLTKQKKIFSCFSNFFFSFSSKLKQTFTFGHGTE